MLNQSLGNRVAGQRIRHNEDLFLRLIESSQNSRQRVVIRRKINLDFYRIEQHCGERRVALRESAEPTLLEHLFEFVPIIPCQPA